MTKTVCRSLLLLVALFGIAGCDDLLTETVSGCSPECSSVNIYNRPVPSPTQRVSAHLFPNAVKVKLYAAETMLNVDGQGKVFRIVYSPSHPEEPDHTPVTNAVELSKQEIASLRKSVFYTLPDSGGRCCLPRHAFLFYDKQDHFLGYLAVCFQCGCAKIVPSNLSNSKYTSIWWDPKRIGKIIQAHGISLKPYDSYSDFGTRKITN